jgi:hypothetical protein
VEIPRWRPRNSKYFYLFYISDRTCLFSSRYLNIIIFFSLRLKIKNQWQYRKKRFVNSQQFSMLLIWLWIYRTHIDVIGLFHISRPVSRQVLSKELQCSRHSRSHRPAQWHRPVHCKAVLTHLHCFLYPFAHRSTFEQFSTGMRRFRKCCPFHVPASFGRLQPPPFTRIRQFI